MNLFFTDTYLPRRNGVAHSVAWSAEALRRLGRKVVVVRPSNGNRAVQSRGDVLVPSVRAFARDYDVGWVGYTESAAEWFRRTRIRPTDVQVIHVHSLGPIGTLGLRCAWKFSIPLVLSWHTDLIEYARTYPEVRVGALLVRAQLSRAPRGSMGHHWSWSLNATAKDLLASVDSVVAPSKKTADDLMRIWPRAHVSVVPTGLPDSFFHPSRLRSADIRQRLGIAPDEKILLFVGRISAEKNPELFLAVARAIGAMRPEVRAVVVGDAGPGRAGRKWRAALVDAGAIVLRSIEHSELIELYAHADLLLVTSLTETQGLTVAEAQALGLPVVCADPALAFFGHRRFPGVTVSAGLTLSDITSEISRVLDSPDDMRSLHGRSGLDDVSELSAQTQALRLVDVYDRLAHDRS
jgi:1,2-diacylglycerol 3-alpha-glucosyltransferase